MESCCTILHCQGQNNTIPLYKLDMTHLSLKSIKEGTHISRDQEKKEIVGMQICFQRSKQSYK
ncbi:hypothetical protein SETIT_8G234300v2 [Setaria italica]|uniref:Uncharacterized protein n=1 Tax=Setaria italica TaxID=4555 RepID=A0A368SB44_SETIT|nr:hypothetical protein SETIT_8G234300v2 [Setaria italica]